MNLRLKQSITIIFTLLIISFLFYFVGIEEIITNFQKISTISIIIFYFFFGVTYILRNIGWKEIFQISEKNVKFSNLFYASGISLLLNEFIPFKMGDLARIEIINKKEEVSYGKVVSTFAILRVFELLSMIFISMFILIILIILGNATEDTMIRNILIIALGLVALFVIFLFLIAFKKDLVLKLVNKLPEKLSQPLEKLIISFQNSIILIISSKIKVLKPFLIVFLGIFIDGSVMFILSDSIDLNISFLVIILSTLVMYISSIIPFLPGGWGIAEIVGSTVLSIFNPSIDLSLLVTLVLIDHLFRLVFSIFYGGISMIKVDYKWKMLNKSLV